jgi:DNA repair protein RadA/Sms
MLLAVLDQRAGIRLSQHDVYVSVVGGVRVGEPGADLAACLALASAATGRPVASDLVALGEVGLGGELRQVAQTPRRLSEASRLGFAQAIVPASGPAEGPLRVRSAATLQEAIGHALAARPGPRAVPLAG